MRNGLEGGLYVVRRSFKAHGVLYEAGQVLEDPTAIKLFRSRLADRDILVLKPGDYNNNQNWVDYLSTRVVGNLDPRIVAMTKKAEPIKPKEQTINKNTTTGTAQKAAKVPTAAKVSTEKSVVTSAKPATRVVKSTSK